MKKTLSNIASSLIILSLVGSNLMTAFPSKAEAQAGAASSCVVGYATGISAAALGAVQQALGVSKSQLGDGATSAVVAGSTNARSFNDCVLKPLGTMIAVALIRNIGSSIVDWVNSGFDGKPSFITDFGGTLLNAADQAVGKLIEGSELNFLCSDFSFQIRIALALKYSKPFKKEISCTLSKIGDNVNNFVENNGGAGWDNWLQITTQPNNNVYGAYLIADSELAQRALTQVDQKYKTISFGSGFDSLQTCDEYETQAEAQARFQAQNSAMTGGFGSEYTPDDTQVTNFGTDDSNFYYSDTSNTDLTNSPFGVSGVDGFSGAINTGGVSASAKPQCKPGKTFIGTPGATIAHKLDSVLGQGEIQAAVAQEIDQVIAAVLNQIVQKTIQGVGGLLGSSKKGSTSGSYIQRYQAQYYGETTASSNTGSQSPIDSYRVISYEDSTALLAGSDSLAVQNINTLIESTTNTAANQTNEQFNAAQDNAANNQDRTRNAALLKTASQSSGSNQGGANDGIKTVSTYMKGSATAVTDRNAWWKVDLEESILIDSVKIWKVVDTRKTDENTLGTFRVLVSEDDINYWAGEWTDGAVIMQPMTVAVNQNGRYVKIEKRAKPYEASGRTYYRPLELAEVEVITTVNTSTGTTTSSGSQSTSGSGTSGQTTQTPTTARVSIEVPSAAVVVRTGLPDIISVPVQIRANSATTIPRIEMDFTLDGKPTRMDSLFISPTIGVKIDGKTVNNAVDSNSSIAFEGVPAGGTSDTSLIISGRANFVQKGTTYKLKITARDAKGTTGAVTATAMIDFVVE